MANLKRPRTFSAIPVIVITLLVYIGLFFGLIYNHLTLPSAPKDSKLAQGLNLTTAWADLQHISHGYHPYNSRRNDDVHSWLLERISQILSDNKQSFSTQYEPTEPKCRSGSWNSTCHFTAKNVTVINDLTSNVTFSSSRSNESVYFEGTNIIVLIKGTQPDDNGKGGVLVNAHYDSVSTGFGATDDGIGIVSLLQLLSYFTVPSHRPRKGIVLLFNNGEEDFLNGARAFVRHPIAQYPRTFLNLEGTGGGGRAAMFRSTDSEVTSAYVKAPFPYGSVVTRDGFDLRLIRSETDYVVFNGELGLRGLDVAYMDPRSKYHTRDDDTRDTSIDSMWSMLSGAVATVKELSSDTGDTFEGDGRKRNDGRVNSGKGSPAVWFDMFGETFALLRLHDMFAISVTLLVVAPLALIGLQVMLGRLDKAYMLTSKKYLHSSDDDNAVRIDGWRGLFRFPIAFILATAAAFALTFLQTKVNPHVVYSSQYAVWSMILSAWFVVAWFVLRGASQVRPTALARHYNFMWMFILMFIVLVGVTVAENNFKIAGGYFMVIYFASVLLAFAISYLEMLGLPKRAKYVEEMTLADGESETLAGSRPLTATAEAEGGEPEEATESTSLLRGNRPASRGTFARYGRRSGDASAEEDGEPLKPQHKLPYEGEQQWSASMPQWLWILQFIILAPINIVLVGQVALIIVTALHQTSADGSEVIYIYLGVALFSMLILLPLGPFLHKFTYHIPLILLFVLIGTLIYNMLTFPFSPTNKMKFFFLQKVDLNTGHNQVDLHGLDGYLQSIVAELPSAQGKSLNCTATDISKRAGLAKCSYPGLAPNAAPSSSTALKATNTKNWLHYNVTRQKGKNEATFTLRGLNTKACRISFDTNISNFTVAGGALDSRFPVVGKQGSKEIRLWHREWDKSWTVNVTWDPITPTEPGRGDRRDPGSGEDVLEKKRVETTRLTGKVMCLWSDWNEDGVIPALDEIRDYAPVWSVVTKAGDGLVEGYKRFDI